MFVLGFHFPADQGNNITDDAVVEKMNAALGDELSSVKEIKIFKASTKNNKRELYTTLSGTDTFFAKALVQQFCVENDEKEPKYIPFTNKYQVSELAKRIDAGNEEVEGLCRWFDGMDPIVLDVTYN